MFFYVLLPGQVSEGEVKSSKPFYGYSFYNPDIVNPQNEMAPFFLDIPEVYEKYIKPVKVQTLGDLTEWRERFCNKASIPDLHYIIYKADLSILQDMRDAIGSKSLTLSYMGDRVSKNSFAKYLYRNKCTETINYLIFAKKCEPHTRKRKAWEEQEKDISAMMRLIESGKEEFLYTESYYFKLRYAYQLIRLAHVAKKYEQVLELYDYLLPKTDNDPSIIEDWIEELRAVAMMNLGQRAEAVYIFSRIFDTCPSRRESAFNHFSIGTDKEWKASLLLCKNEHEQAMLYALRAQNKSSQIIEEMKTIYALDPKHESLEYLTVREVIKLEKDLLGYEFNDKKQLNKRNHNIPRAIAGKEVIELQAFVRELANGEKVKRPSFWKMTEAYLELLSGDYYFAKKTFVEANEMVKNDTLKHQLQALNLALEISLMDKIDSRTEERIYDIRTDNEVYKQYQDFNDFIRDKMAFLYRKQGDEAKAFLCYYKLSELLPYPKQDIVDNLLAICDKPDKTMTEKQMITKADGTSIKNDLLDMKASMYLGQFLPQKALEVYKEMPDETYWDTYGIFDPFIERINDCSSCALSDTALTYNKGELINRLLTMEQEAIVEPNVNKTALIYYKLGLAYYNMTWFSYSWNVVDYTRNKRSLEYAIKNDTDVIPESNTPYGNKEYFDCSKALFYFEKALILSNAPELNAKAAFMASKCEQNAYLLRKNKAIEETHYYYELLNSEYSGTKFYAKLRDKSTDFRKYLEGRLNVESE